MTEIEVELNRLRQLLREARDWDWISFREFRALDPEMAYLELPDLVQLNEDINKALGEGR